MTLMLSIHGGTLRLPTIVTWLIHRVVALTGIGREELLELVRNAVELFGISGRFAFDRDVWPNGRVFGIELEPALKSGLGVGEYGFGRTFRLAHAAVDALVGMDDEHVLAFIEAVDRTHLHAVHVFALDAVVGHHIGQRGGSEGSAVLGGGLG